MIKLLNQRPWLPILVLHLFNKAFLVLNHSFLNQACTSLWLACAWFLKIVSVWMSVCVCMSALRLLITIVV